MKDKVKKLYNNFIIKLNNLAIYWLNKRFTIKIAKTANREQIVKDYFSDRSLLTQHNYTEWYKTGFVFVRILNDYIEIKTIDEYNPNSVYISLDEESLLNYLKYFKTINK
jgi:hypothetical protein